MAIEQIEKICAICGTDHYSPKSGICYGTTHEINGKVVWIGSNCFGAYTCLIAEGYCNWEYIPTIKEIYRKYQQYAKKHKVGEPWWAGGKDGFLYLDIYEKKRYVLEIDLQAFMECAF